MTEAEVREKVLAYGKACYEGTSRGEVFLDLIRSIREFGESAYAYGETTAHNDVLDLMANPPEITFD